MVVEVDGLSLYPMSMTAEDGDPAFSMRVSDGCGSS